MKRYGLIILMIFLASVALTGVAGAATTVRGTKHDLSAPALGGFGPGPIRSSASGTGQVCVFCHTPHSAAAITNAPLWNKNFNPANDPGYTVYSSDVMNALTISAEKPLTSNSPEHLRTRLCLSCHDGTIALGQLANLPAGFSGSQITMVGTGADNKMPQSAAGWIGPELQDDHPVAVLQSSNDLELNIPPSGTKVQTFGGGAQKYVECTSCHDAHSNEFGNFLVESNAGSTICTRCHNKTGFSGSIHDTSARPYQPTDGAGGNLGVTVGGVKCMDCHFPHKAGVEESSKTNPVPTQGKYLLSYKEEQSCFINNPNLDRWNTAGSATSCHGSIGAVNIYGEVNKFYAHKVQDNLRIGKHKATESQLPAVSPWLGATNTDWHVECEDCHNPHTAGGIRIRAKGTNQIGGSGSPLYGTGGVSVGIYPPWGPISTGNYTAIQPTGVIVASPPPVTGVTAEHEICLKCHSDFAWNPISPPNSPSLGMAMTNQAMEFGNNGATASSHPVVFANGNNQGTMRLGSGWTTGNQTMYCSDCHGNDAAVPAGPHGSANRSILYKPYNPMTTGQNAAELCFDCHDFGAYYQNNVPGQTGFSSAVWNLHYRHMQPPPNGVTYQSGVLKACTNCHINPTHGSDKLHLISYQIDPLPYGQYSYLTNYTQAAPGSYAVGNCSAVACHAGSHP